MSHFIQAKRRYIDPQFLHEERLWLEHERDVLRVMELHREQLGRDIERARSLAQKAHIPIDRPRERMSLVLIGIGDRFRRDDGAGPEVARRLRLAHPPGVSILQQEGEPASLLDVWSAADEALVVDGVNSGAEPGTLHRFEVVEQPLPAELFRSTTHALGVAEAVELARERDQLPTRLVVYGIEGESFEAGEGLTPLVQDAVAKLVMDLYRELEGRG